MFPIITRINGNLVGRSEFIAADPLNQPDTPEELRH